jgi:hypothetical protein
MEQNSVDSKILKDLVAPSKRSYHSARTKTLQAGLAHQEKRPPSSRGRKGGGGQRRGARGGELRREKARRLAQRRGR